MSSLPDRLRRDPGGVLLVLALLAALAIYAPTLATGTVNLDDSWLIENNSILAAPSLANAKTVLTDFSPQTRFVLGAEYLPVRDLSIMADRAIWGDHYGGYHATNVALYLAAIALWFFALAELGIERAVAGAAMLIWALHPTHAESVAWLAERKGLLGLAWAGVASVGYARWRRGAGVGSLLLAALGTVAAVWSKAPSAFAIAALAPLDVLAPAPRATARRSIVGLITVAVVGVIAFAPVVMTARAMAVVGGSTAAPASWLPMAFGLHGFYVELAAMIVPNAVSYPVATVGPSLAQILVGAAVLIAVLFAASGRLPARVPRGVAIGAWVWLLGWFPASRLVLPLRNVLAADRYLSFATLGLALVIASAAFRLDRRWCIALITAISLAAGLRAWNARTNWSSSEALWERATASNPSDGDAWAAYSEALARHDADAALRVAIDGYNRTKAPRLALRLALLALDAGDAVRGRKLMEVAAQGGEVRAQANLSTMLLAEGRAADAATLARSATQNAPYYAQAHRALGNAELAQGHNAVAVDELRRAHALAPADVHAGCDLGLALIANGEHAESLLAPCAHDPKYADRIAPPGTSP